MRGIAETYLRSWYDSSPGCNSMRERIELRFTCPYEDRPVPGTKLYISDLAAVPGTVEKLVADRAELLEALTELEAVQSSELIGPEYKQAIYAATKKARTAIARATGERE